MITESDITVGIKSFLRPEALRRTLGALESFDFAAVLVGDDGAISAGKEEVYEWASSTLPGFALLRLPRDVGLSAGRNAIVEECGTDYLLMLDDDQEVPANVMELAEVLDHDLRLGGVSCFWREFGRMKCTATNIHEVGRYVVKDTNDVEIARTPSGVEYILADFVPNSTLFRTACLRDSAWDENFKIGSEHLDFYLAHKRLKKWTFAVVPSVVIEHYPKRKGGYSSNYRHNRDRLRASERYFREKWGKQGVIRGMQVQPVARVAERRLIHWSLKMRVPSPVIAWVISAAALARRLRARFGRMYPAIWRSAGP